MTSHKNMHHGLALFLVYFLEPWCYARQKCDIAAFMIKDRVQYSVIWKAKPLEWQT